MTISDEQRAFFNQKNPSRIYDTVKFTHSEFSEPVRLLLNQHQSMMFNDEEYLPVSAKLTLPSQGENLTPEATVSFSRIYIGDEFKKVINQISPFGWQEPIKMILNQYSELSKQPQLSYTLYVNESGIKFNSQTVEVTASYDNPMLLALPYGSNVPIYTTEQYKGLEDA